MRGAWKFLLGTAIAVALATAPAVLGWLYMESHGNWPEQIKEYQTLIGSLVALFAAGLAAAGVWINVSIQRLNLSDQLAAQRELTAQQIDAQRQAQLDQFENAEVRARAERDEQRRAVAYEGHLQRRQIAAAFKGEMMAIMLLLYTRIPKGTLQAIIDYQLRTKQRSAFSIETDPAVVFKANAGSIGVLPGSLPEYLARFYGMLLSFIEEANRYDKADWNDLGPDVRKALVDRSEKDRAAIEALALEIDKQLGVVIDEPFVWPPISPKTSPPGQLAAVGELLERYNVDPLTLQTWLDQKLTLEEIANRAAMYGKASGHP